MNLKIFKNCIEYTQKNRPFIGLLYIFTLIAIMCLWQNPQNLIYLCIVCILLLILFIDFCYFYKKRKFVLIKYNSFISTACNQNLPEVFYKSFKIKQFHINQSKFTKNNSIKQLNKSYKALNGKINNFLKKYSNKNYTIGLCARCHIPFMFYLGCNLSTLQVKLFETSRYGNKLNEINNKYQQFPLLKQENHIIPKKDTLNLLISISTKIDINDVPNISSFIELFIEDPHFDAILCSQQLDDYAHKFFKILNDCQKNKIKRINLFYAGPMSLAFRLGQIVKPTIHPDIYVYNFSNTDNPNYGWALKLSSNFTYDNIEDYRDNKNV